VLDLIQRPGRTKQSVAHRAVAALRLVVQQGEDPQPQGPQVIRMNRERHRFRIAAGDGLQKLERRVLLAHADPGGGDRQGGPRVHRPGRAILQNPVTGDIC